MSNNENKTLGEIIKDALKEKGLNQTAVAKKMNVSKQVINQLDRRKYFDLDFLERLKKHTDLDFTRYSQSNIEEHASVEETQSQYSLTNVNNVNTVEMTLSVKVRASDTEISQMGNLLMAFKKEALRMGFTIL
ncbi:helix-turn-helix domain-containing protein [Pedobacter ureilyticus]|uniref:Helix-turn-helix domain-containing protein n=1 Tax=Pedobacter ureilyticus TaxID=1393051 RepID=A0ABW9J1R5_9SPHI|nr:helix-turn-helix transcriptional regulator [Pedobacter helvus]